MGSMARELPIHIEKAVVKIYISYKYCRLQSPSRSVVSLVSHNSLPEQELASFFYEGSDGLICLPLRTT